MISRYDVFLNGIALSSISPEILVLDVQYPPVSIKNDSYALARRQGVQIARRYVESNSVTVFFEIQSYDVRTRQAVLAQVVKWAKDGGILHTNDREGQMLKCVCSQFPSITSAKNRIDPLQIVFSAYALPFWQSVIPAKLTLTGTSTNGNLYVPGNVDQSFVELTATANGALSTITFTAGSTAFTLSGLSIASGGTIVVAYDDDMIQSIKTGNTSLLSKRSGSDDLKVNSGESSRFAISANVSCTVEYRVRGLWL